jgi:hypothetical protein
MSQEITQEQSTEQVTTDAPAEPAPIPDQDEPEQTTES